MAGVARYPLAQRLVHWAVVVAVLPGLALGLTIFALGFDGVMASFGQAGTNLIYKYHKTLGVILLGLMVLRIGLKLALGKPDYDPPLTPFQRSASTVVHGLLYVLLLAQPVLGWAATAAGGYPIEFFNAVLPGIVSKDKALSDMLYGVHGTVGLAILALIAVHLAAVVWHRLVLRDGVLTRMSLF